MALGGGTYTVQNKVLPGTYINFISAARATATLGERGTATMPIELDWGADGVIEVTASDFVKNSQDIFGYEYTSDKLRDIRDLFIGASKAYIYRLNSGGAKAACTYAEAKYAGTRGNQLKIVIAANADDPAKFDVDTYLDLSKVDSQTVARAGELVANNYVTWKSSATLAVTAGTSLTGGTNGSSNGSSYQNYLNAIDPYSYNAMGIKVTDDATKKLFVAFNKRMRDEVGSKFQLVLYNYAADYEGVINVKNGVDVVPWVTGIAAGCNVNASNTNRKYDGEAEVSTSYTQSQLETAIKSGEFVLHKVGTEVRVLTDINSLVTTTESKSDDMKSNQTVRVCDQIATDIAAIFNTKYLGVIPNNQSGRVSLWSDIVSEHNQLMTIGAIEEFSGDDVTVTQGNSKKSVVVTDAITVTNAMEQLYMTVTVQ